MITAMIRTHGSRITESFGNFQFLAGLLTDKNKKSHGNIGQQPKNSGKLSKSVRQILLDQFRDVVGIWNNVGTTSNIRLSPLDVELLVFFHHFIGNEVGLISKFYCSTGKCSVILQDVPQLQWFPLVTAA